MRSPRFAIALAGAAALGLFASTAVFQLAAGEQAVISRLGRPEAVVRRPGLHLAWPIMERVTRVDVRPQALEDGPRAVRTADGTEITVQGRLVYRIVDPLRAAQAGDPGIPLEDQLREVLSAALDPALAKVRADDVMADRDGAALTSARDAMRRRTVGLGVAVEAMDVASAEVSPADAQAVYARMTALADRQADAIRTDGERKRQDLLADADRQVGALRGAAEGEALRIRGEGDAQRMAVMGAAFAKDPAFARYFRQIEAYENTLTQGDATLVLSPDNAFLRTFADGPGR